MIASNDRDDLRVGTVEVVLVAGGKRELEADVGEGDMARGERGDPACVCTGGSERLGGGGGGR